MQRSLSSALLGAVLAIGLGGFLTGCEQEGPAERAGERVDETVEQTKEAVDEALEKTGEQVEQAGDAIREKTQE